MTMEHGIPDLGAKKPRVGTQMSAFVRHLDEDGAFEAGQVITAPNGQRVAAPTREQYVSAEELVEMVVQAVVQRVALMLVDSGVIKPTAIMAPEPPVAIP